MRTYQPIWEKLKSLHPDTASSVGVSIKAHRLSHKRIIKAVKKEKWSDLEYKMSIDPRSALLSHKKNGEVITFFLNLTLCAEDF